MRLELVNSPKGGSILHVLGIRVSLLRTPPEHIKSQEAADLVIKLLGNGLGNIQAYL